MTAEGPFHDPVSVGLISSVATASLAWLGQRLVGKAAIQEAINKSFHELMNQLRQELKVAIRERDEARAEADSRAEEIASLKIIIDALELRVAGSIFPRPVG